MGFFHGFVVAPIILSMYDYKHITKKSFSKDLGLGPDANYKLIHDDNTVIINKK